MKAAVQTGSRGVEISEVEAPRPGPCDVLVRVRACGLNRADLGLAAGHLHGAYGGVGTRLGSEWAGEILELGSAVAGLRVGDRVMCSGRGGFAEYAVADYGRVVPIPRDDMSFQEAAALPVALQTMHDAVVTNGRLKRGESILIQGASAGVGLMGLQIARLIGARVILGTSRTPARRNSLAAFGAHVALDSCDPQWPIKACEATGGGVDLIIDQLAGAHANENMKAAAVCGRIVNVGRLAGLRGEFDFDLHALKRLQYVGVTFRTRTLEEVREVNRRMRADLGGALAEGKLAMPVAKSFEFSAVSAALAYVQGNHHLGKIVLMVP